MRLRRRGEGPFCPTPRAPWGYFTLGFGYFTLGFGFSMWFLFLFKKEKDALGLDTLYFTLGFGYFTLGFGYFTLGFGLTTLSRQTRTALGFRD